MRQLPTPLFFTHRKFLIVSQSSSTSQLSPSACGPLIKWLHGSPRWRTVAISADVRRASLYAVCTALKHCEAFCELYPGASNNPSQNSCCFLTHLSVRVVSTFSAPEQANTTAFEQAPLAQFPQKPLTVAFGSGKSSVLEHPPTPNTHSKTKLNFRPMPV